MCAIVGGHITCVDMLISAGARGDAKGAITAAAVRKDAVMLARLIALGADPDEADADGQTVLDRCAERLWGEGVVLLLDCGADPGEGGTASLAMREVVREGGEGGGEAEAERVMEGCYVVRLLRS